MLSRLEVPLRKKAPLKCQHPYDLIALLLWCVLPCVVSYGLLVDSHNVNMSSSKWRRIREGLPKVDFHDENRITPLVLVEFSKQEQIAALWPEEFEEKKITFSCVQYKYILLSHRFFLNDKWWTWHKVALFPKPVYMLSLSVWSSIYLLMIFQHIKDIQHTAPCSWSLFFKGVSWSCENVNAKSKKKIPSEIFLSFFKSLFEKKLWCT